MATASLVVRSLRWRLLFLAGCACLLLAGCATSNPAAAEPHQGPTVIPFDPAAPSVLPPLEEVSVVARVNEVPITSVAFGRELLRTAKLLKMQQGVDWYSAEGVAKIPELRQSTLEQVINQELLRQLAEAEGITVSEARLQAVAGSAAQELMKNLKYNAWDEFLKDFQTSSEEFLESIRLQLLYAELLRRHGGPGEAEQVRIRHILVFTEEEGQEVLRRLAAGEPFETVAQELSKEPGTRRLGGLIEWFPRGTLPAALEEVAFALPVGGTSGLFQTDSGYHVVQVLGHEVRPVRSELLETYQRRNFEAWFAEQKAQAHIEQYVTFVTPTPTP
ncbi:MAG: peptidylprolyl isomerase [Anaerolineae bacterium]